MDASDDGERPARKITAKRLERMIGEHDALMRSIDLVGFDKFEELLSNDPNLAADWATFAEVTHRLAQLCKEVNDAHVPQPLRTLAIVRCRPCGRQLGRITPATTHASWTCCGKALSVDAARIATLIEGGAHTKRTVTIRL